MSKENEIINTNIHFNLKREADRTAWEHLQNRDKSKYRSYSKTIIIALNEYFRRQQLLAEDPLLETHAREESFFQRMAEYLKDALGPFIAGNIARETPIVNPSSPQGMISAGMNPSQQDFTPGSSAMVPSSVIVPTATTLSEDQQQRNRELSDSLLSLFD